MKRKKLASFILGSAFFFAMSGASFATSVATDVNSGDVIPPIGVITVEGASLRGDTYYTSQGTVTLNITAEDNVTPTEEIKMIISKTPLEGTLAADDDEWMDYTTQITNWTLSIPEVNVIYLYLKDNAGNISPSIVQSTVEYTVTYDANGGSSAPASKNAAMGTAFNIAIQEPTYEGKYFLGWSLDPTATSPSWVSDGVIIPKYIKEEYEKENNVVLYAVWTDTPPKLAEVAQVGDYVNYPVNYDNVFTTGSTYKSAYTGWRIINISGDTVELISAGTPLTYKHGNDSSASVAALSGDKFFETFANYDADGNAATFSNGFAPYYISVEAAFDNEYTANVESVDKADIDKVVGEVTTGGYSLTEFGSLLHNNTWYWLASANNGTSLWSVGGNNGHVYSSSYNTSYGVRPKVSLVSNIQTTGRNASGMWEIEIVE